MKRIIGIMALLLGVALATLPRPAFAHVEDFTIDSVTLSAGKSILTVRGTITCTDGEIAGGNILTVFDIQASKKTLGEDEDFLQVVCTGDPQDWETKVIAENDKTWKSGRRVTARAHTVVCLSVDQVSCDTTDHPRLFDVFDKTLKINRPKHGRS
jgi:hypothetical protein